MTEKSPVAAKLRELATEVRSKQNAAEAIAAGFELIAECIEPCIDCGYEAGGQSAALASADNPASGTDVGMGGLDNTTSSAQAE